MEEIIIEIYLISWILLDMKSCIWSITPSKLPVVIFGEAVLVSKYFSYFMSHLDYGMIHKNRF